MLVRGQGKTELGVGSSRLGMYIYIHLDEPRVERGRVNSEDDQMRTVFATAILMKSASMRTG